MASPCRHDHPARILYVIGHLNIGGAQFQLIELVTRLDRRRFEPVVCVLSECATFAADLRHARVQVISLPRKVDPDVTRLWRLSAVLRHHRPALIHSYLFVANAWARLVAHPLHVPIIVSERNTLSHKSMGERIVDRLLAPWATAMIANSEAGARLAISRHEIAPHRVAVVHNGLAIERFSCPPAGAAARQDLGLPLAAPVVGMIARLHPQKDHGTLLQAMTHVVEQLPRARLLCVGDGALRAALQAQARDLGLEHAVVFTGARSDIPALLQAMDVVVLSSRWEGLPNAIMEAMAASRPVVATNVGGIPELLVDGETGLLVPPGDPSALAQATLKLLTDSAMAVEMGRRGRARIVQDFAIERMVTDTEAVYDRLLARRTPPRRARET